MHTETPPMRTSTSPIKGEDDHSVKHAGLTLLVGDEVFERLEEQDFLHSWDLLLDSCPWATVFQGKEFVRTWYKINREKVTPVLILGYKGQELSGLLALAKNRNRRFFGAGIYDTEYQVWLTRPEQSDDFIIKALDELEKRFLHFELSLRFIPPNTPLQWTVTAKIWKNRCLLRPRSRPLLKVDAEHIARELRKKNRKEKLNRLKRLGMLSFERITNPDTFSYTFDIIADQFNFRKAARYNSSYFQSDPNKKAFYLQLFEHNLLHVTVLKLNDEIIASNVGVASKSWVHLKGMNTWSPFYAKHSPGIIHFLMLGQLLSHEGYAVFDLTPGDDPYKNMLATDHDEVHELWIYSNPKAYVKNLVRKELYFKILQYFGTTPLAFEVQLQKKYQSIKAGITAVKQQGVRAAWSQFRKPKASVATTKLFKIDVSGLRAPASNYPIQKNSLKDLLGYTPEGGKAWCDFLTEAVKKYEAGEHSYTFAEEGRLIACVWLKRIDKESSLPSGSLLLHVVYCHPKYKHQLPLILKAVALLVNEERATEKLYCSVSGMKELGSAIAEIGSMVPPGTISEGLVHPKH